MAVVVCVLAPMVYTLLSLAGVAPMTVPIFLGWLAWLQLVHVVVGVALWRRRAMLSTRVKAALLSWGGLAFWYWLPAPVYFVLTMNLDDLQVVWTALTFFWEVPVVGGAFVLAGAAALSRARPPRARPRSRPTVPRGDALPDAGRGAPVRLHPGRVRARHAAAPGVRGATGDRAGEELLARHRDLAAAGGVLTTWHSIGCWSRPGLASPGRPASDSMLVRTVAGRILGVSLAVAISGFALISLFVLQAFQVMVRESATATLTRDLAHLAESPDARRQLGAYPRWGERGQLRLVRGARRSRALSSRRRPAPCWPATAPASCTTRAVS